MKRSKSKFICGKMLKVQVQVKSFKTKKNTMRINRIWRFSKEKKTIINKRNTNLNLKMPVRIMAKLITTKCYLNTVMKYFVRVIKLLLQR